MTAGGSGIRGGAAATLASSGVSDPVCVGTGGGRPAGRPAGRAEILLRPNYRAASRQKQQLTSTLTRARAALSHDADWSFNESYTRQPRAGHKFLEARQAQQMEGRPRIPPARHTHPLLIL